MMSLRGKSALGCHQRWVPVQLKYTVLRILSIVGSIWKKFCSTEEGSEREMRDLL